MWLWRGPAAGFSKFRKRAEPTQFIILHRPSRFKLSSQHKNTSRVYTLHDDLVELLPKLYSAFFALNTTISVSPGSTQTLRVKFAPTQNTTPVAISTTHDSSNLRAASERTNNIYTVQEALRRAHTPAHHDVRRGLALPVRGDHQRRKPVLAGFLHNHVF